MIDKVNIFRKVKDEVRVWNPFENETQPGRITATSQEGTKVFYQVLINNESKSHWWFGAEKVLDEEPVVLDLKQERVLDALRKADMGRMAQHVREQFDKGLTFNEVWSSTQEVENIFRMVSFSARMENKE